MCSRRCGRGDAGLPLRQIAGRRVAPEPPTGRVPAEYLSLYTCLERRYASMVVLTFEQMEALFGFAPPVAARVEHD